MAECFLSENPNFIVGPNSIVTGSHWSHDCGAWGVDFIGNLNLIETCSNIYRIEDASFL